MSKSAPGSVATDAIAIRRLLEAGAPCIVISTAEEQFALRLVRDALLDDGRPLLLWSVARGLFDGRFEDGGLVASTEHPAAALYHLAHQASDPVRAILLDVAPHLEDARTMRLLREAIARARETGSTLVLIDSAGRLPSIIEGDATRLEISLPDEDELEQIVRRTVREVNATRPLKVELTRGNLATIVQNLRGLTRGQSERVIRDCIADDRRLDAHDIARILVLKRQAIAASFGQSVLEFIETPGDLSMIGGLTRLKRWLTQRRQGFSDRAEALGLRPPRGVLLLGVQGAGKSLCAKAIAAAWQLPLLRLDPGALFDRYVGESERRLRDALLSAERMSPIVLWIDEIEKGFASAASRSVDGGLSQRMFGTLLTWMQERSQPVFLVATANDIEALPPELLRKGRFDEIFFVDLPGAATRREILSIHLRRRSQEPADFDLDALVAASAGRSGAEIEEAIVAGLYEVFDRGVTLDTESLRSAILASPPLSVTMAERIDALRAWAVGRCVPADD